MHNQYFLCWKFAFYPKLNFCLSSFSLLFFFYNYKIRIAIITNNSTDAGTLVTYELLWTIEIL